MPIHSLDDDYEMTGRGALSGRRRRPLMTVAVVAVATVVVIALTSFLVRGAGPESSPVPPAPTPGRADTPPATLRTPVASPALKDLTALDQEVAPGLRRSTVTLSEGNESWAYNVPLGWPRTPQGAAAAALHYMAAWWRPAAVSDADRPALRQRMYTSEGLSSGAMSDETLGLIREELKLNNNGQVVDGQGRVSEHERLVAVGMPEYGAYRFLAVGPDLSEAQIETWMPFAVGTMPNDTNVSNVDLFWSQNAVHLRWVDNDWRISRIEITRQEEVPKPRDQSFSNQSFAARAEALGRGWLVPADATEEPITGAIMSR